MEGGSFLSSRLIAMGQRCFKKQLCDKVKPGFVLLPEKTKVRIFFYRPVRWEKGYTGEQLAEACKGLLRLPCYLSKGSRGKYPLAKADQPYAPILIGRKHLMAFFQQLSSPADFSWRDTRAIVANDDDLLISRAEYICYGVAQLLPKSMALLAALIAVHDIEPAPFNGLPGPVDEGFGQALGLLLDKPKPLGPSFARSRPAEEQYGSCGSGHMHKGAFFSLTEKNSILVLSEREQQQGESRNVASVWAFSAW